MSDNWVVQNLENALETWNEKLAEIWQLITTTPQDFKGGGIWGVIVNINGAVQAIGLALLVLFFVVGVVKTCGSFTEVKKPEHALKLFIRFAIAKGAITYGMELMLALFNIVQGTISTIMSSAGFSSPQQTTLPAEMITTIEDCGFFESIPLWAVTLIGGLFITVMSFILIMTVYGRFFKLYMYTALAPIPLSTFAGEPSQNVGKSFIKSYCAVCLEGAVIVLSCIIFSLFASSPPVVNPDAAAVTQVWSYVGELLFNTQNRAKGKNTFIFIDEIYLLFQHEYSANFLFTLWKRVRKYGAYASGITQNVDDLLQSHTARTMLANSEFIIMLNQASTDRIELAKLLNISDTQLSYITNVDAGHGLIKVGSSLVPFANKFPKNTKLYKLMTTKLSDIAN